MVLIKPIGFAADFIPQKIGISIDTNSASSNLEVILLKTILARASTNKNRRAKPAYGLVFLTLGNYPKLLTGLISVLSVVPRSISSISSISG